MVTKSPDKDSFVVLKDTVTELRMTFPGQGPTGFEAYDNGELVNASSIAPWENDVGVNFPAEEPGQHSVRLLVKGTTPDQLEKLSSGEIERPEEEIRGEVSWEILVAERDELFQSDYDIAKQIVHDALALYAAGSIGFEACERIWGYLDEVPEEQREEIVTLDEFVDEEDSDDS